MTYSKNRVMVMKLDGYRRVLILLVTCVLIIPSVVIIDTVKTPPDEKKENMLQHGL